MTSAPGPVLARSTASPARAARLAAGAEARTAEVAVRAAELVAGKVTRKPLETVETILEAHERGDALNRIAADLGVHHSTVQRILDAAQTGPFDHAAPEACE